MYSIIITLSALLISIYFICFFQFFHYFIIKHFKYEQMLDYFDLQIK